MTKVAEPRADRRGETHPCRGDRIACAFALDANGMDLPFLPRGSSTPFADPLGTFRGRRG